MEKHKGGRPTRLTPETQERICDAIRAGNYVDVAAAHAGVHRTQLYRWLNLGANAKSGIHREFHEAVDQAMAAGEVRDLDTIKAASATQWQAAAWRLERRFPDRWGRKERVEHVGADGAPLPAPTTQITVNLLSEEELERRIYAILPHGVNGNGKVLPSGTPQS